MVAGRVERGGGEGGKGGKGGEGGEGVEGGEGEEGDLFIFWELKEIKFNLESGTVSLCFIPAD